jgi:hypothetical protein
MNKQEGSTMPQVFRWYIGHIRGVVDCKFDVRDNWNQRTVLVTASEGFDADQPFESSDMPSRFVGNATIRVSNIAPRDGGVTFKVHVEWDEPLPVWADIHVFDEFIAEFLRSR